MSGFRFSLRSASVPVALLLAAPWLISPARALGLTGPFDLANWDLVFTPGDPTATAPDSLPNGQYQCAVPFASTACVDGPALSGSPPNSIETNPGGFTVVGAIPENFPAYESSLYSFETNWVLDPIKSDRQTPYQISFNFLFDSQDQSQGILGYFSVNGSRTLVQESTSGQSTSFSYTILPGDTIAFGVRKKAFDSNLIGAVNITDFNAEPVPAPLPLLGAGAAFGWSRRLRRRIRSQVAVASR